MPSAKHRILSWKRIDAAAAAAVLCLLTGTAVLLIERPEAVRPASAPLPSPKAGERAPLDGWAALSESQRATLHPLQARWDSLDAASKIRWLQVADDLRSRPPLEVERAQRHMAEWVALSNAQRIQARLRYTAIARMPAAERRERWLAYQHHHDAVARAASGSNSTPPTAASLADEGGVPALEAVRASDPANAALRPVGTLVRQPVKAGTPANAGEDS